MKNILLIACLLAFGKITVVAQNTMRTDTLVVNGDCNMCKKTIEMTCYGVKGVKKADWDPDELRLVLTYDSGKTTPDAVLKRIALAGYDNQNYRALDKAYFKLHECCQYDRSRITTPTNQN